MARVMDLTKSPTRPSVEVGAFPSFDLLVSLLTFQSREGVDTFDSGPDWFDEVERRMTPALRGALERLGPHLSQEWGSLAGFAIRGPQAEPLDAFLERLRADDPVDLWLSMIGFHAPNRDAPPREIFVRAAGGDDAARAEVERWAAVHGWGQDTNVLATLARTPEQLRADVCEVLERWREDVYSQDEARLREILLADAEAKRAMSTTMGPEKLIDAASNGLEYTPHSWIRSVVLVPHVAMRPWNVLCSHDSEFILGYPVADETLGIDATAPPPGLLRLYKALGDEKRLRMLGILARSSATLQELADGVGLAKSSAHHHLVILRAAGLVRVTTEEFSRYTLRRDVIPEASALLEDFIGRER
ncbi:MAG: ArsR/SmtB family transcription factor [Actinomycetota bacterium]